MLKPYRMIRNTLESAEEKRLPRDFGLLCWNVHKQNLGHTFDRFLGELMERYGIDLVAFQEVKIHSSKGSILDSFHFSLAPNIRFLNHVYGVLNGSRMKEIETFSLLSSHREAMIQTRKSAIFSIYPMDTGEPLLVVNLHAINFRENTVYNKELDAVFERIRRYFGAMIVTGDFNSWNKKRIAFVMKMAGALELQAVEIEQAHLIKSFMNCKLDHIFYRGLKLIESRAVDVGNLSDHNALYARFRSL